MKGLPSEKKKKRGGKINFYGYIPAEMYDALSAFRDPDLGDRWESALLRRIIREWLAGKKLPPPSDGGKSSKEEHTGTEKKSPEPGTFHSPHLEIYRKRAHTGG